jgi:Flp pilus assembly CpaF family ATPase
MSLETILPFLQPIEHLILDPSLSEVMVNGDGAIFTHATVCWPRSMQQSNRSTWLTR